MNDNFGSLKYQFEVELTQKDWAMFWSAASKRVIERPVIRLKLFWFNLMIWIGIIVFFTLFKKEIGSFHIPSIAVSCLLFVGVLFDIVLIWHLQKNGFTPPKKSFWVEEHTFFFFENVLIVESATSKCIYSWKLIKKIKDENGNLFIFIDSSLGYVFPKIKIQNIKELEVTLYCLCKGRE